MTPKYNKNDKCTSWVAADIINMSERTGRRWLSVLRKAKGYKPSHPVSVGEFCEYYNLNMEVS